MASVGRVLTAGAWYPRWRLAHTRVLACAALAAACLGALLPTPALGLQLGVLAVGVAVLGLPHGAVDPWLVARNPGWARFGLAYVGLAVAVVALWLLLPAACLAVFLAVSALHFGLEDREPGLLPAALAPLETAARGALPVAGPILFHTSETAALFAFLVPVDTGAIAALAHRAAATAGPVWLASLAAVASAHAFVWRRQGDPRSGAAALEIASLGLAAVVLPPLLFFGLYFCVGHSPRHALRTAAGFDPGDPVRAARRWVARAAPLTALAVAGGALGWMALSARGSSLEAAAQVVFVGLAALTAPHLAVAASGGRETPAAPA